MNNHDPFVLLSLICANIPESDVAEMLGTDTQTVNQLLDCYNIGFDSALFYVGNRIEKAGFNEDQIAVVLGTDMYPNLKEHITTMPNWGGETISIERLSSMPKPELWEKLRSLFDGKEQ